MTNRTIARPVALLALVGGLSGCIVHQGEADVTFLWDFGELTCEEAGVTAIEVYLEDLDDGSFEEDVVPCVDYGVAYEGLEPGPYVVQFFGDNGWFAEAEYRLRSGDNEVRVHLTR